MRLQDDIRLVPGCARDRLDHPRGVDNHWVVEKCPGEWDLAIGGHIGGEAARIFAGLRDAHDEVVGAVDALFLGRLFEARLLRPFLRSRSNTASKQTNIWPPRSKYRSSASMHSLESGSLGPRMSTHEASSGTSL